MSKKVDWEAIKADKHRINYLGNSVKGLQDRYGKTAMWYNKMEEKPLDDEARLKIRLQDELAMMSALGFSVPEVKLEKKALEDNDYLALIERDGTASEGLSGERVMGIGKGPSRQLDVITENMLVVSSKSTNSEQKKRENVIVLDPDSNPVVSIATKSKESSNGDDKKDKVKQQHRHRHHHSSGNDEGRSTHHHRYHRERSRSKSRSRS